MIEVEGFAVDGVLGVVHPDLANILHLEQALYNLSVVVALITEATEN